MKRLVKLLRCTRAASAVEFALVLPLLMLLVFGIIDGARFLWEYNEAEKATQMGVRHAVVTNLVAGGLDEYSFAVDDGILAGNPVPTANFDRAVCQNGGCTCSGGNVCGDVSFDGAAFAAIVDRMNIIYPAISAANVSIEYRNVGLGYAGDPNGPDVAPLVTVRLNGLSFQPITTYLFDLPIAMPDFRAALTLEDGDGAVSN